MNDDSWQDLDPVEQMVLLHGKVLGVRYPGGASSGYIDDMSDGDDEDSGLRSTGWEVLPFGWRGVGGDRG
jgi:hypothetical protein